MLQVLALNHYLITSFHGLVLPSLVEISLLHHDSEVPAPWKDMACCTIHMLKSWGWLKKGLWLELKDLTFHCTPLFAIMISCAIGGIP